MGRQKHIFYDNKTSCVLLGTWKNLVLLAISLIENKKLVKAMGKAIITFFISLLGLSTGFANDTPNATYSSGLCDRLVLSALRFKKGKPSKNLFPNENQCDLVQRLNRTDIFLYPGKTDSTEGFKIRTF
ncbi:hypothetical protein [Coxiella-like endosymbiont]|uniref:hypothetical protein n=1 Tax=Coxiella-like endosymbiont TaxID=1592897 RepID=UPI00272D9A2E|nr:hypothetical protein [Coxiella-like endosymbiont]